MRRLSKTTKAPAGETGAFDSTSKSNYFLAVRFVVFFAAVFLAGAFLAAGLFAVVFFFNATARNLC